MPWGAMNCPRTLALVFIAEHGNPITLQVVNGHSVPQSWGIVYAAHAVELADIDVVLPEHHGVRPVDVAPHGNEPAFHVEDLDPVGLPVHHVHPLLVVDGDVVRSDKLAGVNARLSPGKFVIAASAVDVDSGVAVAVRNIDVAVAGADGRRGRAVKGLATPARSRVVALTDLHHLFARGAELLYGVDAVVSGQQRVVSSAVVQAMSPVAEMPLAEGPYEVAVPVENHDGMLPPG